jgi:hypothetical protein
MNSYKNSFRNVLMALLGGAVLAMSSCKKEKDEPVVRDDVEYTYGNTNDSMTDFYPLSGSNAENHLKQKKGNVTLIADKNHPDGSNGWYAFSYKAIDLLANKMLKPVYELDPSSVFFGGDTIYFKAAEMEKAQASIDWMKARNIKVATRYAVYR